MPEPFPVPPNAGPGPGAPARRRATFGGTGKGSGMSLASLPQVEKPSVANLRDALTKAIAGEVRFDRLDRALYSTDASVYQIVPLGVVLPKATDDVIAT